MRSCFVKQFYALVLVLLHGSASIVRANIRCIESERQALLNIKHGLIDRSGMLSSWRHDDNNSDCCKWRGVQCDHETSHVNILDLRASHTQYLEGAFNITSLAALQNIQYLDLSYNDFRWTHIPKQMGSFTNLRYLNLSYNDLSGELPYQLGSLQQLRYLDLSNNDLNEELPYQLANLSQLRYLGLGGNSFSGALPFQVGNLSMLHTLRLGGNFLFKFKDAQWLSNLYSLTVLDLNAFYNLGTSYYWPQVINKLLRNLTELRLSDCSLSDTNLQSLFNSHSNLSTSLTILDLSGNMLTLSTFQFYWLFNSTANLRILDLSENMLESPIPDGFGNMCALKRIDLSYNNLQGEIPSFFGNMSTLQSIDLSWNKLLGEIPSFFGNMSTLQSIDLSGNNLQGEIPSFFGNMSTLQSIDLSGNNLQGEIPSFFGNMSTLQSIDLSGNNLQGDIPSFFGNMSTLQSIDLSGNNLQGEIPSFFGNMCALQNIKFSNNQLNGTISSFIENSSWCNRHIFQHLDLSYNQITGKLPKSIGLLSELVYLNLEGNYLEGEVTELHLSNFSNLKYLSLSGKSVSLKLVPNWVPPFRLNELDLRSCNLGPNFPSWIQSQLDLIHLDISDNGINDSAPDSFWNNLQQMEFLNMSHNTLKGALPNISIKYIYLNSNQFEGKVSSLFLRQAIELTLSENKLSDLSSFLCDKSTESNLEGLDLSNNQITGQLPNCWKSMEPLNILDLRNNQLSGKIPLSMGTLVNLDFLILRNNSLVGELPSTLKNCKHLVVLDVGENMLTGSIPSWIGSMQQLMILNMEGNRFFGNIPNHLCHLKNIHLLHLSRNHLSRGIPTCLKNHTAMTENTINRSDAENFSFALVYFAFIMTWTWKGAEQRFKYLGLNLKSIDLSCNNLTGDIPIEVGYLFGLMSLNLSRNNLSGEIPSEIGNLSSLESLDLSRNHLSGTIPSSISEIDNLGKLDLSHNSLYGRIPSGRHFETFEASCFEGNVDLCGRQLNKSCPGDVDQTRTVKHEEAGVNDDDSVFYEALYMGLGLGYFTGFWGLLGPILLRRPWRNAYIRFMNKLTNYMYVWLR
ncbi:hypothetical protein Fmac_016066 [Flemingia macrophylla]|uniref:Leucine-rich repeat-containing N-terminal plant-type domain-containing protein n=1 Tax=Flemingia macrophylla TaxID=520843 RepID=A0ABD1MGD4_9FABA